MAKQPLHHGNRLPARGYSGIDIAFTVDEYAIALDGEAETVLVDFGRSGDAHKAQQIFDSVA